jgi:hypothetical protein
MRAFIDADIFTPLMPPPMRCHYYAASRLTAPFH